MDRKSSAARAVEDVPASRPGPISIIAIVVILGAILIADNWTTLKGLFS